MTAMTSMMDMGWLNKGKPSFGRARNGIGSGHDVSSLCDNVAYDELWGNMITGYGMCLMTNGWMDRSEICSSCILEFLFFELFIHWKGRSEGNT